MIGKIEYWMSIMEARDENLWQIASLTELILASFEATREKIDPSLLNFTKLFEMCSKTKSKVVHLKTIFISLLLMRLNPSK